MNSVLICGSRRGEALRTLRRTFATASKLSVPSAVDRPTVRELLAASTALPSLPPGKCIASLAEVTSTAITEKKEEDLLESPDFVALLQRVESRLFGFSANEAYLLVSCLARLSAGNASVARLPGVAAVSRIVQISLEQLSGEWQELSDMELAHAAQLLSNFARDGIEVDFTGLRQVLRARADGKRLSSRALCLATAAMAQAPQHCLEELAISLAAVARSEDRLSPTQLSSLALCLVRLGQSQAGLVVDALPRLAAVGEELSTEALCAVVETAAVLREREVLELLLRRCTEVAHGFPAGAAIRILKSYAACGLLPEDLAWILLLQVAKVSRSTLGEPVEQGLHQVMLSLLHDPAAADALRTIHASTDLWEACYRPEDIDPERSSWAVPTAFVEQLQADLNLRVEQDMRIADFYVLPLMLYGPDDSCVALDFDTTSPPWLPEAEQPRRLFQLLKQRHLALWNIPLIWLRSCPRAKLEEQGPYLEAALRRALVGPMS
ncbi:unnamed protein product [Symbiodinium sp. CCMP2592]|nr:unnamed protein product [Symbiodinium sp. CCMP2592]